MKGIINKGVQELVTSQFGNDIWESVKKRADCDEPFFSASQDYPDELTTDLVSAASVVTGVPFDTLLVEFGKRWLRNTGAQAYPHLVQLAGTTARAFLLNIDKVHQHATRSIANARPPRFTYDELSDGRLRIHYRSERRLCLVLEGLILGVGLTFGERLEVVEIACMKKGDAVCTMEVTFHGS